MIDGQLTNVDLEAISNFKPTQKVALIVEKLCNVTAKSQLELFQFAKELSYRNAMEMQTARSSTDPGPQRANRVFLRAFELTGQNEELMQDFDAFMSFISREKCILMLATAEIELTDRGQYSIT